jgi:lipid-binding SYLF domain-containing protein
MRHFADVLAGGLVSSLSQSRAWFGGQCGRGYISCRNSSPADGARQAESDRRWSVGLQIGASETDVILLVMNERGTERCSPAGLPSAPTRIAAGPVGRQASAQTDATLTAEILAWSRSRGAYAGISLQGSTLREDAGENKELYGREMPNKEIVLGNTPAPRGAEALLAALGKFK